MRRVAIAVTAIAFALLGPRITAPHDKPAGEPFVYEAPEGFASARQLEHEGEQEWVHPANPGHAVAARVAVERVRKAGNVELADLARIADGMPNLLSATGVTWTTIRQETRTRADGTRVGLIEGECTKKTEGMLGELTVTYRRLLLVFPTDDGTALTTALYGKDEIAVWQPVFEATIGKARGVALRVPPPPNWMHGAWGGAGLVLAWLAAGLLGKRKADSEVEAKAKARDDEEDDEDEEDDA